MDLTLALLSPRDFARFDRDSELTLETGLAYLIQGRIHDFHRAVTQDPFDQDEKIERQFQGESGLLLLTALAVAQLGVTEDLVDSLLRSAENRAETADRQCARALIGSLALAQLGRDRAAGELCQTVRERISGENPIFGLALSLQLSLRHAVVGEFEKSLEEAQAAGRFWNLSETRDGRAALVSKVLTGLRLSIDRNIEVISSRVAGGVGARTFNDELEFSRFWVEKDSLLEEVGVEYFGERYAEQVDNSANLNRPVVFGGSDKTARKVAAYHVACELSGHWIKSRDSASLLARERAIRATEADKSLTIATSLILLRKYDQHKSLLSLGRLVRAEGPLSILADETEKSVDRLGTSAGSSRSNLVILRCGADLLTSERADAALTALLPNLEVHSQVDAAGWYRSADYVLHAMAQLASRSANPTPWLRQSRGQIDQLDAVATRRFASVLSSVNWQLVDDSEVEEWRTWASNNSGHPEFAAMAEATLACQAQSGLDAAATVLLERFRESPNASLAATLLNLRLNIDYVHLADVEVAISDICVRNLDILVQEASQGSYSVGGTDIVHLAAVTATYYGSERIWSMLAKVLADVNVANSQTSAALDWLSDRVKTVPGSVVDQILQRPDSPVVDDVGLFGGDDERTAARFRFSCAVGGQSPERALTELYDASSRRNNRDRWEAARSAPYVGFLAGHDVAASVALRLAFDQAVVVRLEAIRSLVRMHARLDGPLGALVLRAIEGSLVSDGLAEVGSALSELMVQRELGEKEAVRSLLSILMDISIRHVSPAIRQNASTLIAAVGTDAGASSESGLE